MFRNVSKISVHHPRHEILAWSEIQELSCELTNEDQMMRSFSLSKEEIDTMMHMDMLSCKQKLKVWDFKVVLGKMKTNVNLLILNPSAESRLTPCRKIRQIVSKCFLTSLLRSLKESWLRFLHIVPCLLISSPFLLGLENLNAAWESEYAVVLWWNVIKYIWMWPCVYRSPLWFDFIVTIVTIYPAQIGFRLFFSESVITRTLNITNILKRFTKVMRDWFSK